MKREKIKERNDFLIEEIKQHKGRENSISEKALAQVLADNGYGRGVCVHTLLRKLKPVSIAWDDCDHGEVETEDEE